MVEQIARLRTRTQTGRLFDRVLEIDFAAAHFQVPWSEVTAEEVKGLQILKEERHKRQEELAEERRKEWEAQRRNRC